MTLNSILEGPNDYILRFTAKPSSVNANIEFVMVHPEGVNITSANDSRGYMEYYDGSTGTFNKFTPRISYYEQARRITIECVHDGTTGKYNYSLCFGLKKMRQ